MAETNVVAKATTEVPTWQRVPALADLVEIFDPGMQVCAWRCEIDPAIEAYLSGLHQTGASQVIETLSPAAY